MLCVSVNSNEAQILQKQGTEWKTTEVLAEVNTVASSRKVFVKANTLHNPSARQNHNFHRLGPEHEPYRYLLAGPKRVCLDTDARCIDGRDRLEADTRLAAHQPCCDVRTLEPE